MKSRIVVVAIPMLVAALAFGQESEVVKKKMRVEKEVMRDASGMRSAVTKEDDGSMTIRGFVVDANCAKSMLKNSETTMKKAAAHTRGCALEEECAASGYGVFANGKYYKFDKKGDKEAQSMLEKTDTEKAILVKVNGKMEGENFAVASLSEAKGRMMDKNMEKRMEKKMMDGHEGHKH